MKKMRIGVIISVAFACGIFVYTEWDNRRFVNSVSPPPVVDEHTHPHPHEHPHPQEETAPATSSTTSVFDTQTIIVEKSVSPTPSEEETAQVETDYVEENPPEWQTGDEHEHEHKSTKSPFGEELKDLNEMDPDDYADMIRVGLLKQFGDIPEVHTFVELTRKIKKNEELSLDERIDFTAAQYHLWPDPRTKETLEIFLEKRATEYPRSTNIVR